jgi:hypothetical protein
LGDPASHVAESNESEFYLICRKTFHIAVQASASPEQEQVRCHPERASLQPNDCLG